MTADELARVGAALDAALAGASDACILPTASTRLRIELLAADAVAVRRIGGSLVELRSNPSVAGPEL